MDILSSVPPYWQPPPYWDGLNGTSLAAPHVAGAVALLISAVPELRGRVDLIEMLLKTSAEPRASSECTPGGGVPNNVWGWGMLNVYQAVLAAQALELGAIEGQVVDAGTLEPIEYVKLTFADQRWAGLTQTRATAWVSTNTPPGRALMTSPPASYGYLDRRSVGWRSAQVSPPLWIWR